MDTKALSGMFRERESTERAYKLLIEKGYSKEEINLLMSTKTHERFFILEESELESADHASKCSSVGGTMGAIGPIGTSQLIPGLEILVAGPLAADLKGSDVIGGLVGSGIPEAKAKLYDSGIRKGNVLIAVTPKDDADAIYLQSKWKKNQGEEIHY